MPLLEEGCRGLMDMPRHQQQAKLQTTTTRTCARLPTRWLRSSRGASRTSSEMSQLRSWRAWHLSWRQSSGDGLGGSNVVARNDCRDGCRSDNWQHPVRGKRLHVETVNSSGLAAFRRHLQGTSASLICWQEHHLMGERWSEARVAIERRGWDIIGAEAKATTGKGS